MVKRKKSRKSHKKAGLLGTIGKMISTVGRRAPKWMLYGTAAINAGAVMYKSFQESSGDPVQFGQRLLLRTTGIGSDGRFYWQYPAQTYAGTLIPSYVARKL